MDLEREQVNAVTDPDQEYVGYAQAGEYLDLQRNTLSSYVTRGIGPRVHRRQVEGQYVQPVFVRSELDRWKKARPGQGARTDLIKAAP